MWYQYQQFLKVEIIRVDPYLTIYKGCGNSIVLTSKDGSKALIVDTKMKSAAELLRKQRHCNRHHHRQHP